jgi:hypothetical protein
MVSEEASSLHREDDSADNQGRPLKDRIFPEAVNRA